MAAYLNLIGRILVHVACRGRCLSRCFRNVFGSRSPNNSKMGDCRTPFFGGFLEFWEDFS